MQATDTPILPVMTLQQLSSINNSYIQNKAKSNNPNQEESEENVLLDLSSLNLNDISNELKQKKDDLKFDHQTILQHIDNSQYLLSKKQYTNKLTKINNEIENLKAMKEALDIERENKTKMLIESIKSNEQTIAELNQQIDYATNENISTALIEERNYWLHEQEKKEIEVLSIKQQIVDIDNDIIRLKRENNMATDELEKKSIQGIQKNAILLNTFNIDVDYKQNRCFIEENTFLNIDDYKNSLELENYAWNALKQSNNNMNL